LRKCESAFTLTASASFHLLPACPIFKKNEIILDSFKLNFNLHSTLLNLSYLFHSHKKKLLRPNYPSSPSLV